MLSPNVPSSPMVVAPHAPSSPVYSKWALDSSTSGFVDEADFTKRLTIQEDPLNTVRFSIHHAQVEAYSPIEDKLYVNADDNLFAVFDGHGGDICSRYVADKLPKQLLCSLKKRKPTLECDFVSMLKSAFMQTDSDFFERAQTCGENLPFGLLRRYGARTKRHVVRVQLGRLASSSRD